LTKLNIAAGYEPKPCCFPPHRKLGTFVFFIVRDMYWTLDHRIAPKTEYFGNLR